MAYPAFKQLLGSRRIVRTGIKLDQDGDGLVRGRKMHTTRYDFQLIHVASPENLSTFLAYHVANENLTFDVVFQGSTYVVRFGEPPYDWDTSLGKQSNRLRVNLVAA